MKLEAAYGVEYMYLRLPYVHTFINDCRSRGMKAQIFFKLLAQIGY